MVLTGDSAGANLAIAVTMLAIREGIRVPDVIVPVYPGFFCSFGKGGECDFLLGF